MFNSDVGDLLFAGLGVVSDDSLVSAGFGVEGG